MNFFNFICKKYIKQTILVLVLFTAVLFYAFKGGYQNLNWLDPVIGFATLLVSITVWINDIKKSYLENLPKRLTAYFEFGGRNVIVFRNILLFNESDIRAWAQQIARQKAGGDIQFEPFFRFKDSGVETAKNGSAFKSYEITFFLSGIPEKLKSKLGYDTPDAKKWCMEWHQIEKDGSITMEEHQIPSNPKM